jgi:hypothetical protein
MSFSKYGSRYLNQAHSAKFMTNIIGIAVISAEIQQLHHYGFLLE